MKKLTNLQEKKEEYFYNFTDSLKYSRKSFVEKIFEASGVKLDLGIYWSSYEPKNFGDWVTPYLHFRLTRKRLIRQSPSKHLKTIFSTGSIIRHINVADSVIVWGSGAISKEDNFLAPHKICAVRGPLTRDIFVSKGIECPEVFGDPAILLPRVFCPVVAKEPRKIGIIPHFKELPLFDSIDLPSNYFIIDVTLPIEEVITKINSCNFALSSSLHGLIVSHAYRVPCAWVRFSDTASERIIGDDTKFLDYFFSVGMESFAEMIIISPDLMPTLDEARDMATSIPLPKLGLLQDRLLSVCPMPILKDFVKSC